MKISKVIFVILIISNIIGVTFVAKDRYNELLVSEQELLQVHTERLKRAVESEIMVTEIIDELVNINNGSIDEDDFYSLSEILSTSLVKSSIAYIPNGIIKYLYPPEFSEGVVGNNVLQSANDATDSIKARDTKKVVISGPYELFEGALGIVIRNPIYYEGKFWGLVTVALDANDLFDYVGFDTLKRQGYEFKLTTQSNTSSETLATETEKYSSEDALSHTVAIGDSSWTLGLYTKGKTNIVVSDVMFWFLIFLFTIFILYYFMQRIETTKENLTKKLEHDSLTGAYSRIKLQKYYDTTKASLAKKHFALFFIDLNKFKPVNDNYGHKVGDKLLKAYVERLKNEMKAETLIVRLGGDEFVVLTPHVDNDELCTIIKRKIITLSEVVFLIDSLQIHISASIGYVLSTEADTLETLLTLADEKMYSEKGEKAR